MKFINVLLILLLMVSFDAHLDWSLMSPGFEAWRDKLGRELDLEDDCLSKDMFEDVFSSTLLVRKQVGWVDL